MRKKFNIIRQTNSLGAAKSVKPKVDAAKSEEAYIKKFVAAPGTPRHIRFLMWWKTDTGRMVGLGLPAYSVSIKVIYNFFVYRMSFFNTSIERAFSKDFIHNDFSRP